MVIQFIYCPKCKIRAKKTMFETNYMENGFVSVHEITIWSCHGEESHLKHFRRYDTHSVEIPLQLVRYPKERQNV